MEFTQRHICYTAHSTPESDADSTYNSILNMAQVDTGENTISLSPDADHRAEM
jgi:hypothetical protein